LTGVQARGRLQVRQCARDDADIHTIEQPTEARHNEEKAVIKNLLVVKRRADCGLSSHRFVVTWMSRKLINWL
jgi:hypothetical protein